MNGGMKRLVQNAVALAVDEVEWRGVRGFWTVTTHSGLRLGRRRGRLASDIVRR